VSKISTDILAAGLHTGASARNEAALERVKNLANQQVNDIKKIDKAASDFEALLLHQMLKSMWKTVEHSGLFAEDNNASQIFRDMLNEAIANSTAEGRGIGIKKYLREELIRADATSNPRKA